MKWIKCRDCLPNVGQKILIRIGNKKLDKAVLVDEDTVFLLVFFSSSISWEWKPYKESKYHIKLF